MTVQRQTQRFVLLIRALSPRTRIHINICLTNEAIKFFCSSPKWNYNISKLVRIQETFMNNKIQIWNAKKRQKNYTVASESWRQTKKICLHHSLPAFQLFPLSFFPLLFTWVRPKFFCCIFMREKASASVCQPLRQRRGSFFLLFSNFSLIFKRERSFYTY